MSVRIVADGAIPWLEEAFASFGDLERHPGSSMDPAHVREADVLLVRTVTRVDAELLRGSRVQFVGSASAGTEHVDIEFLHDQQVAFAHAPGANAMAVAQYVMTALFASAAPRPRSWLRTSAIGVLGFGHIGRLVTTLARSLGLEVLVCDPLLEEARQQSNALAAFDPATRAIVEAEAFVPFSDLLERSEILTLHVPLTRSGEHPTHHLINASALDAFRGSLLLHTCRGSVVDESALLRWLDDDHRAVVDVWEHEPHVDPRLLEHPCIELATPHIAGYSEDGKARATQAIHRALAHHLGRAPSFEPHHVLVTPPRLLETAGVGTTVERLAKLLRAANPLHVDDLELRALTAVGPGARAAAFENLRRRYVFRPEFSRCRVSPSEHEDEREDESLPCSLRTAVTRLGFAPPQRP